jgi:hypothetical protein
VWKRRPLSSIPVEEDEDLVPKPRILMDFDNLSDLIQSRRLSAGFACFTAVIQTNEVPEKQVVCSFHRTETIPDHNNIYQCRIIHER